MKDLKKTKIPVKEGELISEGYKFRTAGFPDIDREIFARDYIRNYISKKTGLFVITPEGERLFSALTKYFTARIIRTFKFKGIILPKMSPVTTYAKAMVLGKWDYYLEKVSPFTKTFGVKQDYILEPLQCVPFYQMLENKKIEIAEPVKVFDCSGPTYRNEDLDKIKPMVKQREFHRAEFIYLGTKKQVVALREGIMKEIIAILDEFGIRHRIVVGAGCFELSKNEIIYPETIEEIPIKDIELFIPSAGKWVELVGASVLWDIQTKRFNITADTKEAVWSGCVGFGLERLMYCFLAQKGFDEKKWPKAIQKLVGEDGK